MNLQPTMQLRWLRTTHNIEFVMPGMATSWVEVKLQQWWHDPRTGSNSGTGWGGEWRDIPNVVGEPVFQGPTHEFQTTNRG